MPPIAGVIVSPMAATLIAMPKKPPASDLDRNAGLRLRAAREVLGFKQEQLANRIGVGRTALANWEGGKLPDIRAMVRLLQETGIPLEWIYAGSLQRVDYDLAEELRAKAAQLGAVVGGAVAEWPMAVSRRDALGTPREASAVPASARHRTLHE